MPTFNFPHYNSILTNYFKPNYEVIFKPSALQIPYNPVDGWPIQFPEVSDLSRDNVIVIIHFQDSLTFKDDKCLEIEKVEQHYKEHCDKVVVVIEDIHLESYYKGPLHLIWFPTFCYETMQQCYKYKSQWDTYSQAQNTKTWQCLNGIPKTFRKNVAFYLQENFDNGILSLGGGYIDLPTHAYDEVYWNCGNDNPENFLMLDWVYRDCAINIVTETIYNTRPGIITEKTLFAFLAGQIPLCIGYPGMISDFKDMGFDMFDDIIDTSYDWLPNNERWRAAIDLNADLIRSNISRLDYSERLGYNKNYALRVWPQRCIDWYEKQLHNLDFNIVQGNFLSLDKVVQP